MTIRGVARCVVAGRLRPGRLAARERRDQDHRERRRPKVQGEGRAQPECLDDEAADGRSHHERERIGAVGHAHGGPGARAEPLGDPGLEGRPERGPRGGLEELAGGQAGDVAGGEIERRGAADPDRRRA